MSLNTLKINTEAQKLAPSALLELFILDSSDQGGGILRFYSGVGENNQPVRYQGEVYNPFPVQVTGFESKSQGSPPRPSVAFANVHGVFTGLGLLFDDLIGSKFIRRKVYARFLDGADEADPLAHFPDDVFVLERKSRENKLVVEYEMGICIDVEGVKLPRRQVLANSCTFKYRGPDCGFAETLFVSDTKNTAYLNSLKTNILGNLTSNSNPSGYTAFDDASSTSAYRVFDGFTAAPSVSSWSKAATSGHVGVMLPFSCTPARYVLYPVPDALTKAPTAWTFEGTVDGSNWVVLDTQTAQNAWVAEQPLTYDVSGLDRFFGFRLNVTSVNGGSALSFAEFQIMASYYRGPWSETSVYYRNDEVSRTIRGINQMFKLKVAEASGLVSAPPNNNYWLADQCSKRLFGCKLRFDPLNQNLPIPFGGFPGTARLPEV